VQNCVFVRQLVEALRHTGGVLAADTGIPIAAAPEGLIVAAHARGVAAGHPPDGCLTCDGASFRTWGTTRLTGPE